VIVLGIGITNGGHDSSAAIIADGRLVAAAEEERFTRVKHDGALPLEAIRFCLTHAGVTMDDVDVIAIPERPYRTGRESNLAWVDVRSFRDLAQRGLVRRRSYFHKRLLDVAGGRHWPYGISISTFMSESLRSLRGEFGQLPPVRFFGHHESHASAAFYLSGFDESAVLTVDGRGGYDSAVIWHGGPQRIRPLYTQHYADSLGNFYDDCTSYLGLGDFSNAGKTMGLSAYGDSCRFEKAVGAMYHFDQLPFRYTRPPSQDLLGFAPRDGADIMSGQYADFAAAAQRIVEGAMATLTRVAMDLTGAANLCLGGGVAMNCSANGKIHAMDGVDHLSLFPAASDAGLSVGAALLAAAAAGESAGTRLDDAYLGPACTEDEIRSAISKTRGRIDVRRMPSESAVAELIISGAVVGWVQGRMEFGPRALGARSILADARSSAIRDHVNRCKGRELWRPLAPMILEEHAAEYFEGLDRSRFMMLAVPVRARCRSRIEGAVHVDGSARPQTVPRDGPQRLRRLLQAVHARIGVPVLLNTSFNAAGEPLVCTPADAVRAFLRMGLDALVIEDWLITRPGSLAGAE
jgi:carbamoyltransferase